MRIFVLFAVILLYGATGQFSQAQQIDLTVPPEREADTEEIWRKELTIFENRANGDMGYYLSLATPGYMSWPAPAAVPLSFERLSQQIGDGQIMPAGEVISVTKKGLSFDGDTALAFFETHRTRRAGGAAVDERFENIHVWVKRNDEWRLIANMSRPVIQDRASLSGPIEESE